MARGLGEEVGQDRHMSLRSHTSPMAPLPASSYPGLPHDRHYCVACMTIHPVCPPSSALDGRPGGGRLGTCLGEEVGRYRPCFAVCRRTPRPCICMNSSWSPTISGGSRSTVTVTTPF
jgi:hypothetical protein